MMVNITRPPTAFRVSNQQSFAPSDRLGFWLRMEILCNRRLGTGFWHMSYSRRKPGSVSARRPSEDGVNSQIGHLSNDFGTIAVFVIGDMGKIKEKEQYMGLKGLRNF